MFLEKDFKFEAAHRLQHHRGKCRNVHGHSWVVRVKIEGEIGEGGMVMDFARMKEICGEEIERLDHSMMVSEEDVDFVKFLAERGMKVYITKGDPTSERMAMELFERWYPMFEREGVRLVSVVVEETCTSRSECVGIFKNFGGKEGN